jgi:hypothetical protein
MLASEGTAIFYKQFSSAIILQQPFVTLQRGSTACAQYFLMSACVMMNMYTSRNENSAADHREK